MSRTAGIILHTTSPEGVLDAALGQKCIDTTSGLEYRKTTAAGTLTGWAVVPTNQATRPRQAWSWLRDNSKGQTFPRIGFAIQAYTPTSGRLELAGGIVLAAGDPISHITALSSAAVVTPTNQWACLVRCSDDTILAKSTDKTNTAWGANSFQTFDLAAAYTPSVDTPVWIGLVQVAATPATLIQPGGAPGNALRAATPRIFVTANTGLTDPASLSGLGAKTDVGSSPFWAEVS